MWENGHCGAPLPKSTGVRALLFQDLLDWVSGHVGSSPFEIVLALSFLILPSIGLLVASNYRPSLSGKAAIAERPPLPSSAILCFLDGKAANLVCPPSRNNYNSRSLLPPDSARRAESTSDSDPKMISLSLSFPAGSYPSLLKSAWASPVRSPLAFSRSPLNPLLSGFLPLFLILDGAHLVSDPSWVFSLGWLTSCASNPTPLGAPPLCCLAGPHYTLEKNYWEEAERTLRWLRRCVSHVSPSPGLVKLLVLSNQQACGSFAPDGLVSPDFMLHFYLCWLPTTSIALSTCTNALSVCGISKPSWQLCIDSIRQVLCLWLNSTSALISLIALLLNLFQVCIIMKSLVSPSFHLLRWLKGSACDLRGTQAAAQQKKRWLGGIDVRETKLMINSEWHLQEVNHLMSQTCCEKCINMRGFETFPKNQSSIWNWLAVKKTGVCWKF